MQSPRSIDILYDSTIDFTGMKYSKKEKLSQLFTGKTDNIFIQFFRYFGVTLSCFALDFSILFVLTEIADIHYQISTFVGYMSGMFLNYLLSTSWVFKTRRVQNKPLEFSVFMTIGIIGMFVNQGIMLLFTDVLGLYFILSRMISAVIGYIWKFFARKYILFHKKPNTSTKTKTEEDQSSSS